MGQGEFKFAIGEIVSLVLGNYDFQILERLRQECPGGHQNWYVGRVAAHLRGGKMTIETEPVRFQEIEMKARVREPDSVFDWLMMAKDLLAASCDFESASDVRDLADKIKAKNKPA